MSPPSYKTGASIRGQGAKTLGVAESGQMQAREGWQFLLVPFNYLAGKRF